MIKPVCAATGACNLFDVTDFLLFRPPVPRDVEAPEKPDGVFDCHPHPLPHVALSI
jgi:hypothetical protein